LHEEVVVDLAELRSFHGRRDRGGATENKSPFGIANDFMMKIVDRKRPR